MVEYETAKQAYDASLASGVASAIQSAADDLRKKKALANEKAAAAGKPFPFPGLI